MGWVEKTVEILPVTRATQGRMFGISGGDDYGGGEFSLDERYGINAKRSATDNCCRPFLYLMRDIKSHLFDYSIRCRGLSNREHCGD